MSLLQKLGIISVEKNIISEIKVDQEIIEDIEIVRSLISNINQGRYSINELERRDLDLLRLLREKDDKNYKKLRKILMKVHSSMNDGENPFSMKWLERLLESLEVSECLHKKEEITILDEYHSLIGNVNLNDDLINDFFKAHSNFFKIKPHKKLAKQIKKILKSHIQKLTFQTKGPTITDSELHNLQHRLHDYFNSSYFLNLIKIYDLKKIKVSVYLCGSLVTGFASKHSPHRNLPSDYKRISDVDMGIVVDNDSIKKIRLNGRCLFKNGTYYGPFYQKNSQKLGPFMKIYSYVHDLTLAKKNNRKLGFVVVDDNFFNNNMKKDSHLTLFDEVIHLN